MEQQQLIDLIEKDTETSDKTKQTYVNLLKRIKASSPDFKIPLEKGEDLAKVKKMLSKQSNVNTQLQFLNVLIVLRNKLDMESKKLKQYRKTLQLERADKQIDKMDKLNDTIMEYNDFKNELRKVADGKDDIKYIVNFLLFNYGLRNADLDITITSNIKEYQKDDTNYLYVYDGVGKKPKDVESYTYKRAKYKTAKTYGVKTIEIDDLQFQKAIGNIPYGKIFNNAQINNGIRKHLINGMTEGKIFKMLMKHYIETNRPDKIKKLAESRGTDIKTIREYYNMAVKKSPLDLAQMKIDDDLEEKIGEDDFEEESGTQIIKIKKPRKKKQKKPEDTPGMEIPLKKKPEPEVKLVEGAKPVMLKKSKKIEKKI
jgi:hypothetical protein